MPSEAEAAKRAIVDRFRETADAYNASTEKVAQLEAAIAAEKEFQSALQNVASDCYSAARLFNFDLIKEFNETVLAKQHSEHRPEVAITPPPAPQATKPLLIKDLVLQAAQQAYPNAVRASALREALGAAGHSIHEKTIGMTLYRLLKSGIVRRTGRDWYFVPEHERAEHGNSPKPSGTGELELQPQERRQ